MLKMVPLDRAINEKCCSVDEGRGTCPLFFCPIPEDLTAQESPLHGNLPSKAKVLMSGGSPGMGGGGQAQLELTDVLYELFHVPGKSRLG